MYALGEVEKYYCTYNYQAKYIYFVCVILYSYMYSVILFVAKQQIEVNI